MDKKTINLLIESDKTELKNATEALAILDKGIDTLLMELADVDAMISHKIETVQTAMNAREWLDKWVKYYTDSIAEKQAELDALDNSEG